MIGLKSYRSDTCVETTETWMDGRLLSPIFHALLVVSDKNLQTDTLTEMTNKFKLGLITTKKSTPFATGPSNFLDTLTRSKRELFKI